jgi:dienelactone hydrolase
MIATGTPEEGKRASRPHRLRLTEGAHSWWRIILVAAVLVVVVPPAQAAFEPPAEPFSETEIFIAGGAAGTLILPAGAADRLTPVLVILQDGDQPDGRAARYIGPLLASGLAVLEMIALPDDGLAGVLNALTQHPRLAGQPVGLLGFGAGARVAAGWSEPLGARALLYPGCAGLAPTAMQGGPVLLMHGTADPVNETGACSSLEQAMTASGMVVRLQVLDQASYAWDMPAFSGQGRAQLRRPDGGGRVSAQAQPELAALSASEVARFFATNLLGQRP